MSLLPNFLFWHDYLCAISSLFFVWVSIKHLNSTCFNTKTENVWQFMVHCVISDGSIFVENVKFVVKLKVYIISHRWWRNVDCYKQAISYNKCNGHETDVFVIRMKFNQSNHMIWSIGIILRNLIYNCNLASKSKSILEIFNGSIWKIFLSNDSTYMECLLLKWLIEFNGSILHNQIIHLYISKSFNLHCIKEYDCIHSIFNIIPKLLVKPPHYMSYFWRLHWKWCYKAIRWWKKRRSRKTISLHNKKKIRRLQKRLFGNIPWNAQDCNQIDLYLL